MDLPEDNADVEKRIPEGDIPACVCIKGSRYKAGGAEGILTGGTLLTFTSVLNTAYDATARQIPYVIFLEEAGEDLRHIHRYLTILKHFGLLERASGIIFGEWAGMPGNRRRGLQRQFPRRHV